MEKITIKQYKELLPINEKHGKWLDDKITTMRIYQPFSHLFEEIYYHFYKRDDKWQIVSECYEESIEGILKLVTEKAVILADSMSSDSILLPVATTEDMISNYQNLIFNEDAISDNWLTDVYMLTEVIQRHYLKEDEVLRVYMLNTKGYNPKVGDLFLIENIYNLPRWRQVSELDEWINFKEIEKELLKLCLHTPQLAFFSIDIVTTSDGFKISKMNSNPPYPGCDETFNVEINKYLHFCLQNKNVTQEVCKRSNHKEGLYPEGFYPHLETTFFSEYLTALKLNKSASLCQELWARKRGFKPYRLEQYGITASNHTRFISDLEYEYLGHINNKYRVWLEDKITIKYMLNSFSECMPAYYYLITLKNGKNRIIPLMDCPFNDEASYDDIFRLVRKKKILALKPDEGTHGAGFFKFTYQDEKYYLNGRKVTKEQIIALLDDINNQYLITEFIRQHPSIAKIYSGSVNTARLIVFKKDGKKAEIGTGYMRFGTSETGGVDNIGAGGIGADLDVQSGYYSNAIKINNNGNREQCLNHPDSGVLIEGYLPNWDDIVQTILKIAESLPEIEYMGFDVAFTESGVKLPEINRFPDFPRINKLTPATMDYLLDKLKKKKEKYGYLDAEGDQNLISL